MRFVEDLTKPHRGFVPYWVLPGRAPLMRPLPAEQVALASDPTFGDCAMAFTGGCSNLFRMINRNLFETEILGVGVSTARPLDQDANR